MFYEASKRPQAWTVDGTPRAVAGRRSVCDENM